MVNGLKECRILGATVQREYIQCFKAKLQLTLVRAETHGSTDWTFPFLKGFCGDSKKKFSILIAQRQVAIGTDRSSAAGTDHAANPPLIIFSLSLAHPPASTRVHAFQICLLSDICPLKWCLLLVKPILPGLAYNIHPPFPLQEHYHAPLRASN